MSYNLENFQNSSDERQFSSESSKKTFASLASHEAMLSECLKKANYLTSVCHLQIPAVTSLSDLNSQFFVCLFKSIYNVPLLDLKELQSLEDEIHNVQVVIDTLSLDVLNISLSHINGEHIIEGNLSEIYYLLEVFEACLVALSRSTKCSQGVQDTEHDVFDWICSSCGYQLRYDQFHPSSIQKFCPVCGKPTNDRSISTSTDKEESSSSSKENISATLSGSTVPESKTSETYALAMSLASGETESPSNEQKLQQMMTQSSSSSPPPPQETNTLNGTSSLLEEVDESENRKFQKYLNEQDWEEQVRLKRKINASTSPEMSIKDRMIQTSDSLLNKKLRTEDDISEFNDVIVLYKGNMKRKIKCLMENGVRDKARLKTIEKAYREAISPSYLRRKPLRCRKSFLLPTDLRRRKCLRNKASEKHKRSAEIVADFPINQSSSLNCQQIFSERNDTLPQQALHNSYSSESCLDHQISYSGEDDENEPPSEKQDYDDDNSHELIRRMRENLPGLYVSPVTTRIMENKLFKHSTTLYNTVKDELNKKTPLEIETEEVIRKQKALAHILKKDLEHKRHLNNVKESRGLAQMYKGKLRDANIESARMKQYYEKYYTNFRKKMQTRNAQDDFRFKNVLDNAMKIQKEDVLHLRNQLKQRHDKEAVYHNVFLEALENLYQTQYNLMAESLVNDNKCTLEQIKEREKIIRNKKRYLKKKMEDDIKDMQDTLLRNNADTHFLELDVNQFQEDLTRNYDLRP